MMRSLKLLLSAVFLLTSVSGAAVAAQDTHKHKKGTTAQTVSKTHGGKSVFKEASKGKAGVGGKNSVVATNHKRGKRKSQY